MLPSGMLLMEVTPGPFLLCAVAADADNNNAFDVWVMVGAGVPGYALRGLGYNPAPLVLGLVLGPLVALVAPAAHACMQARARGRPPKGS